MGTRRNFFKSLAILPALLKSPVDVMPDGDYDLPIPCDLSFKSFQWAISCGQFHGLGWPKILLVGPENKFHARELLGDENPIPSNSSEVNWFQLINVRWAITREFPYNAWALQFENGRVVSRVHA